MRSNDRQLSSLLSGARQALAIGIGGGGDVVGAYASALLCREYGTPARLGGIAWERLPIDPYPGPRRADEIVDAQPLAGGLLLAGPKTCTEHGALFAESRMAKLLSEETVLIDPSGGPAAIASALVAAASALGVDVVIAVDVGGDVLGNGSEPGLASPLCDAVMLAAIVLARRRGLDAVAGVFGPGCDGELEPVELLDRLAVIASAGGLVGVWGMTQVVTDELERAAAVIPTEASAQAIRCARGEIGETTIRRGHRRVTLSPLGAMTFYFDPEIAIGSVASLAHAVIEAESLEHANDILHRLGVRTELDYERENAVEA